MMTLAAAGASQLLQDLALTLVVAAGVTMTLRRVKIGAIPGYLIAGALIGPHLLGLVEDPDSVESISQLAVVMLMFGIGMHMDLETLRGGMLRTLAIGIASTLGTTLIATPLGVLYGLDLPAAIAVGMALSMSSTAVVLRQLLRDREIKQTHGRLVFGVLVTQDLLVIAFLAMVPMLAVWHTGGEPDEAAAATPWTSTLLQVFSRACIAVGGIGLTIVLGRWLLPKLMTLATRRADPEVLLVLAGGAAFGTAVIASKIGFSPELGAFLAGFLLAPTVFKHQVEGQLTPIRDLFMAVFFVSVGLKLDLAAVAPVWGRVVLAIPIVLLLKTLTIGLSAWALGAPGPTALRSGVTLSQAGEFTLVVIAAALAAGLLSDAAASSVVAVVVVTLIVTPLLGELGKRLAPAAVRLPSSPLSPRMQDAAEPQTDELTTRSVIIAGFGPVGRALAQRLEIRGVPYTIVDLNTATIERQRKLGRNAIFGDVTNTNVLHSAGFEHADAVVLTIPDDEAMLRAVRTIRGESADVLIAVRANVMSKGLAARQAGADVVTVEEVAAAEAMAGDVLTALEARCGVAGADGEG